MDELQGVESDRLSCPYLFWSFLAAELVLSLRRKGKRQAARLTLYRWDHLLAVTAQDYYKLSLVG